MMISTKEHNLRNTIFFTIKTIALILVICFMIELPVQIIGKVTAANKVYYISDIKTYQADSESEAKRLCENDGYIFAPKNLNAGSGKDAVVFMGYKLTEDKREAICSIKLLHMDSGYQIKDYKEANADLEKSNYGTAETMYASANEFIVNYKSGSPKAIEAYEGLNLFKVPEADNAKLGDYILSKKATKEFFAKVVTHASSGAVNAITNFLAMGLTTKEKEKDKKTGKEVDITWADNVKNSNLWGIIEDTSLSKDELDEYDRDMGDAARELHKQLQKFATNFENGEASFNEKKYVEEAKKTGADDIVKNADKPSEEDTAMAYVKAYNFLNKYQANESMPLGEYLVEIGKQTSDQVDLKKLYPIIDSMSHAQSRMAGMAGLTSVISNLGENKEDENVKKIIEKSKQKLQEELKEDSFSIWVNTNPEMADKKVAFTNETLRVNAAGQLINAEASNKWDDTKKTINEVLKWIDVGSCAIGLLTLFTGEYGLAGGLLVALKSSVSVVATTVTSIASKMVAITAAVTSWAGIFALVVLAFTIWFYVVSLIIDYIQKNKPKKYTEMAEFAVDAKILNNRTYSLIYKAVKDNQGRIADLNAYQAQKGWVCMYISDDPNSGSPIRADENGNIFNIVYGDAGNQNGYDCASFFGQITPGNCNTGAKKDEVNGIYINYYTEESLANRAQGGSSGSSAKPAAGTKLYYSEIVVKSAKTAESAKAKLIKEGFQVFDQNLCPDARKALIKEDQYTYLGFKTTNSPDLAIRDIRVATYTTEKSMSFGQLSYAFAGHLGYPAETKDEDKNLPEDLDGLYYTTMKGAGTPIEVGKLHLVSKHSDAKAGWEPVTTFSGLPYNFATSRYSMPQSSGGAGRYRSRPYSYTGYATTEDWEPKNIRSYMYYEPEETYTEGTKYLSGVFFAFGMDSENGVGYQDAPEDLIRHLFEELSDNPFIEQPNGCKDVNLAQSFYYKGYIVDSNQKHMRMYYAWTYNPYRALTDVQAFRGEPYISRLPYNISKAVKYNPKPSGGASATATYAASSVIIQRCVGMREANIRAIAPENAYMAPNGLLGDEYDTVYEGFTREDQGSLKTADGVMPWLPTNLYVTGYVEGAPRLTLDSVVVTKNKHDATNNNGVITCDVSEETTLAGNKPSGSFNSVQEIKDPYKLEAFNVALPSWTDDRGKPSNSDADNGEYFHSGAKVYMYIKHDTVKKRYISRIFVGASSRDDSKSKEKDVLKAYDKQVDLLAMQAATGAASDEMIPFDVAGDPAKSWTRTLKPDYQPKAPDGGDPAAYVSVARTDSIDKAIKSIVLFRSDAKAVPDQQQFDSAVYYCASPTTPIKMNDNKTYYIYYSYNQGTVPGKPFTELDISENVFVSGCATALVVDRADITKEDPELHKIQVTQAAEFKGDINHAVFIKGKYEADKMFYNKIYTASGDSAKDAQLRLLEQGCTEFLDMDLNKNAGGKYIYFGYRSFGLNQKNIDMASSADLKAAEFETQTQEAVYDIICTVGEPFHPEGIVTERYQLYYSPVAKEDKNHNLIGTNLNEGTTGPEIYMYYATTYAAKRYNEKAMTDPDKVLSTMPKDYMKSPLTKIAFAEFDYVPYSVDLVQQTPGGETPVAWERVLKKDYSGFVELNEGAIKFDSSHMTGDNRVSMFVQRESGFVKGAAEITGGYLTSSVTENQLYLEK